MKSLRDVGTWVTRITDGAERIKLHVSDIRITRHVPALGLFFLDNDNVWYYSPVPFHVDAIASYLENRMDGKRRIEARRVPAELGEVLHNKI